MEVYTDGACSGNPGPGGWCVVFNFGERVKKISGGEERTTGNRMELTAVIKALEYAERIGIKNIFVYSDSLYVVNGISKRWFDLWESNNWLLKNKKKVKNEDLWKELKRMLDVKNMNIEMQHIKGHNGNPLNELADSEAVKQTLKIKQRILKR